MKPAPQRGFIDNRPLFWIVPILCAIALVRYYELRTGEDPINLLERVSPMAWRFLATVAIILVAGALVGALLGRNGGRRDLRSFPSAERTVIVLRSSTAQVRGGTLAALGLASLVFGLLGQGWGWWIVTAIGVAVCALGLDVAGRGRRWALAKDRVQTESLWYWIGKRGESWLLDSGTPRQLALQVHRRGGAFGQPLTEEHCVLLDKRLLFSTDNPGRAAAFAEEAQRAYPGASLIEGSD